ncbi:hypothetical protein C1H46_011346 [Malus baccata]|uniref:tRNA (adenine(58)-N(1))-methyltransferase n=1 Tax=Malus baccata TaxID=106549 RepID=A0A540MW24_MALBA|nr:hypothetical protein C1H46_011346 [Malus baccata]
MLPVDPTKKLSFTRCISDGDLVIVYEKYDTMKAVEVCAGSVLGNRFGVFKHSDWIGKQFGSKVLSSKGGFVYLLAPTPELWTLVLSHRTQILYTADISFVIMFLELVPGCLVLESGTGSGSLTTSLARAVAPTGHVYTFDFHEQRAVSAREDFEKTGLSNLVTVGVRDIQGEGFPDEFSGRADSVFLDLPQPWLAIPSAAKMLKQDGVLCSFSPCIEQVQRASETMRSSFTDIRTFEILLRTYEVREWKLVDFQGDQAGSVGSHPRKRQHRSNEGSNAQETTGSPTVMARPCSEARGHTGYLTFARLKCLSFVFSRDLKALKTCASFSTCFAFQNPNLQIKMQSTALAPSPSTSFLKPPCRNSIPKAFQLLPSTSLIHVDNLTKDMIILKARAASVPESADEASKQGGLVKTLQLGSMYLLNIYFNIYNKQKLEFEGQSLFIGSGSLSISSNGHSVSVWLRDCDDYPDVGS